MARPGTPPRGLHIGRYLAVLLAVLVLLYGVVLLAGPGSRPLTPTLALDLQGGASVTLLAQPENGRPASPEQLSTAVDIIRQRVNGAGVSEAEVVVQGQNIVVSVPGGNRASIRNVTQTAQLRFREVLDTAPGSPQAAAPPELLTPPTADEAAPTGTPAPSAEPGASATPSARGRAVPRALLAQASPSAPAQPSAEPSAQPSAQPSAEPAPVGDPPVRSGDPATDESFEALNCSLEENRRGTGSTDAPDEQIVACDADGSTKYRLDVAEVVGTDVAGATASRDTQGTGAWQVVVDFTGEGQDRFTALTEATVGKQVAIVLDGVVQSAPTINQRIDAEAQITGNFTQRSARDLANVLRYGALPLTFVAQEEQTVSPTLGSDQLRSGLLAGGLGLLAVVVYSLLYYRALGFVTIASLLVSAALTYAMICILSRQIGFALSLAGIAGFIVAVGITADSFVVYFERLKDEIKEGRTPRAAVDRAWVRARRTILSADTVSFLAAVILYFVSVGSVRGFAFTLGLSTLLDVVVVFLFTRPMVSLLSRYRWFSRSRTTGFFGPDGGDPVTTVPGGRPRTAASEA